MLVTTPSSEQVLRSRSWKEADRAAGVLTLSALRFNGKAVAAYLQSGRELTLLAYGRPVGRLVPMPQRVDP